MTTADIPTGYLAALRLEQTAITRAAIDAREPLAAPLRPTGAPPGLRLVADPPWRARANCLGIEPGWFYPADWDHSTRDAAMRVCEGCEVAPQCLAAALEQPETFGIWGGTTEQERRRLRRQLPRMARCRGCGGRFRKTTSGQAYCGDECRAVSAKYRREVAAHPERRRSSRARSVAS